MSKPPEKIIDFHVHLFLDKLERRQNRIVYGSDFPNLIFPREDEIECLREFGLSDNFYAKLFYETGRGLLTG